MFRRPRAEEDVEISASASPEVLDKGRFPENHGEKDGSPKAGRAYGHLSPEAAHMRQIHLEGKFMENAEHACPPRVDVACLLEDEYEDVRWEAEDRLLGVMDTSNLGLQVAQ